MIFGEKTRIEEHIIELLDKGAIEGALLLTKLQKDYSPTVTKQAMYLALRKLIKEEIIHKSSGYYSLNRFWIQKMKAFTDRHTDSSTNIDPMNILDFEDGESVTYRFKNPFTLDITWGHLYDILFENNDVHQVMLNHHPHEWLMLSRTETEKFWLNQINKQSKMMLFTISGKTELDSRFQKNWSSDYVKINTGESYGLKPNQYLSVVGDYMFEVTTDPKFEERVDRFFKENKTINDSAKKQIEAISKQRYKSKLKISKNKKKADIWRKKFKKDFYIPKPYYL
jgi:hypothetical protein